MPRAVTWALAALLCLVLGGSHLLDGPTEYDAAVATAGAVHDLEDWP